MRPWTRGDFGRVIGEIPLSGTGSATFSKQVLAGSSHLSKAGGRSMINYYLRMREGLGARGSE